MNKMISVILAATLLGCGMTFPTANVRADAGKVKTAVFSSADNGDGVLRVLAVGNSFSIDAMEYLPSIAIKYGCSDFVLGNLYVGGCSIDMHCSYIEQDSPTYVYLKNSGSGWSQLESTNFSYAANDEAWDVVIVQQVSGYSGDADSYGNLPKLISLIKDRVTSSVTFGWHMTWAYQNGSTHSDFPKYGSNQAKMFDAICKCVNDIVLKNNDISFVIPSGTAIQNARTVLGDVLTRDGFHLSQESGRYIAALTWFKSLFGGTLDKCIKNGSGILAEHEQKIMAEAVDNAFDAPFSVTKGKLGLYPDLSFQKYKVLSMNFRDNSFWNSSDGSGLHATIIDSASAPGTGNLNYFVCTDRMFTKDDIPVGSIIVLEEGYKFRSDKWDADKSRATERDNPITSHMTYVDESWWEKYTYRAFNVSLSSGALLSDYRAVKTSLKVYVPLPPLGDIDGNGKINVTDCLKLKMYFKKIIALSESQLKEADVDRNGKLTATDYILMKRYATSN